MSRNECEQGTIKLPSGEFAKVRQAVQEVDLAIKQRAFEMTQEFWKGLPRKARADRKAYLDAVADWGASRYAEANRSASLYHPRSGDQDLDREAATMAEWMLSQVVYRHSAYGVQETPPRRVHKDDVDWPTTRTATFRSFIGAATIAFDRRTSTVEWQTDHNNHAVEKARSSLLGRAFFGGLGKVRWARGTGGVIVGNDEYTQDSSALGYGANYATEGWGYVGAERAPACTKPFVNSKGVRVAPRLRQW